MNATAQRPPMEVRIHDTKIGIWQDNPSDPTLHRDVYGGLIRGLRARGWTIRADPKIRRHFRVLNPSHRLAYRGDMRAAINIAGRCVEIEYWAETWPISNRNGRRYDFDKLPRMNFLDRLRFRLECARVTDWLRGLGPVKIDAPIPDTATALEKIERGYAESWHSDKELGRPVCTSDYNCKSKDGGTVEHGQTVWFAGRDGRIRRGVAFYNINSMWWVVTGKFGRENLSCHEIYVRCPADLRRKHNERIRRDRLEGALATAMRRMDFGRAATLRAILFGDAPVYLIWSRKNDAYYRSNRCGYTTDTISAGRYTREEAFAECRRVPHILEAIGPEGERIRFDEPAGNRAA